MWRSFKQKRQAVIINKKGKGKPYIVKGDLRTIMAGLACGKPSRCAWEILKECADVFIACSDEIAKQGMRIFANPLGNDSPVISGASGAVTLGLIHCLLTNKKYKSLKNKLDINSDSQILLFSTEGDTDPWYYRKIVHTGM